MPKKLVITFSNDKLTLSQALRQFYESVAPGASHERAYRFFECVGRLKGDNLVGDQLADYVTEDAFMAGIWYAKTYPDEITVELKDVEDEPKESKKARRKTIQKPLVQRDEDNAYG